MTVPYSPPGHGFDVDADTLIAGAEATAASANAALDPVAYLAAYVPPVHALRPSERVCDGTDTGTSTAPYMPTHGAHVDAAGEICRAVGFGNGSQHASVAYVPRLRIAASGTATAEVASDDTLSIPPRIMTARPADPGATLDPLALSLLYPENGPFGFSCRDLGQTYVRDAAASATVTLDTTDTTIASVSAPALAHMSALSVYGVSASEGPFTGELDFDEWPDASPVLYRFGHRGRIREGSVIQGPLRDLAALDRMVYARTGAILASQWRDTDTGAVLRPYPSSSAAWRWLFRGVFHTLPGDRLPGSANVRGASSGTTAPDRGALDVSVWCKDVVARFGVRQITRAGTYGQTSTFGAWVWTSCGTTLTTFQRIDATALLPVGIEPGDDYEIALAFSWAANGVTAADGQVRGWLVTEAPLSTV